jgi:hypothetical protein
VLFVAGIVMIKKRCGNEFHQLLHRIINNREIYAILGKETLSQFLKRDRLGLSSINYYTEIRQRSIYALGNKPNPNAAMPLIEMAIMIPGFVIHQQP